MRVRFDISEEPFVYKFGDIKIGEYFGINKYDHIYIGIKIGIHEALVYGDKDRISPYKKVIDYTEEIIPYDAVVALREDRGREKCE